MKTRKPTIIYNQDSSNVFYVTEEPIKPLHLERMVREVADAGVDIMLICANAQLTNYPSKVWQSGWDGYEPGDASFWGSVPAEAIPRREQRIQQEKRLAEQGCDYLEYSLKCCRKYKMTPGVTVRMNDMHDKPYPDSHMHSRFYKENESLHLDLPGQVGWASKGLDYTHKKVRDYYLLLIEEIVRDYDLDVLELDFLRFTHYFPRVDATEKCPIMNRFIRRVRDTIEKHNKRISLFVRIAATPAGARELGFDVKAWADQGLVDGITASMFLNTGWNIPVDSFRELIGGKVKFFVGSEATADRRAMLPMRSFPLSDELVRGFAAGYLATDVDGIYFFNYFTTREAGCEKDPHFKALKELKSPRDLIRKPRIHLLTSGVTQLEADLPLQIPVTVNYKQSRSFDILLARSGHKTVKMVVVFNGERVDKERLWLRINSQPAGHAAKVSKGDKSYRKTNRGECAKDQALFTAEFTVPMRFVNDGTNSLVIRHEGEAIQVLGLEVHIG